MRLGLEIGWDPWGTLPHFLPQRSRPRAPPAELAASGIG
jgi:hypothetical protein